MFKKIPFIVILILSTSFLVLALHNNINYSSEPGYVGTTVCGMCHKKEDAGQQLKIWQGSKHSQAYKTLQTEKADKIAKEKGFKTKAVNTKECLKCHAIGYDLDASLLGKKFKVEDGVQCETCHGPGSDYKSKKIMKDRTLSKEKGLIIYDNPKELCVKCHNDDSPVFKGFNFEEAWAKIKHSKPE
jgi:hypothetical protein